MKMASLSLPTTRCILPSLLPTHTPKTQSSYNLQCLAKASHSQFYGLKLSTATCNSIPASSSSFKSSILAKVSKGQVPPSFNLKDQEGRNVSLSKFKGKPVVVYFYPADETPGCTKQACAFRDSYEKFKRAGAEVIGISGDDTSSHKAFAKKYRLPFTLLSDEGNKVRKEWGVPADLFGALPGRQTYVLDKNGFVQLIYNNQFQPEKHIDETLKLLQSL
ncbi:Alkyl hydroperoxide reductase subunit C/ Thiol specific antioxidant [Dillenia turbinata]|uniref:Peroxiredoxin Q, chloroplastic n=1 Tax=Dillenia turbinata TaxID=194707 RepID=A0AAN8WDR7_9MAGN